VNVLGAAWDGRPVTRHLVGRWLGKGFSAIMDQGLFALSNFALNVMLARWLAPRDYGAFTVAFTAFLFLGTFHSALLTEPMLVFGSARYGGRFAEYVSVLLWAHWVLVGAGSGVLLAAGLVAGLFDHGALPRALLGFALAGPFILLMWLLRRACYLQRRPQWAACAGAGYLVLMVAGLALLNDRGWLSMSSALALLGVAGALTSAWLSLRLGVALPALRGDRLARDAVRAHWEYGRWAAAAMVLTWAPGDIYYLLLPMWRGLDASAALKALINLTMPIRNTNIALALVILPRLVRTRGTQEFGRLAALATAALAALSVLYWLPVVVFRRPVMAWLYGGRYGAGLETLALLGAFLLLSAGVDILGGALRALERPDQVFRANVLATAVALTVGLWSTIAWGVPGAAVGLVLSSVVRAAAMWRYYRAGEAAAPRRRKPMIGAADVV
jgi:O-antigen/teichoic acid export membrane protein